MKIKVLAATTLAVLMGAPMSASAAGWFTAPIQNVELTSTGDIIVFLAGSTNHECGSKRVDYSAPSGAAAKNILAGLLSWQAQGMSISLYISGCDGSSTTALFTTVMNQN